MSDQLIPRKSEASSFLDRVVAFGVHHKILFPARQRELSNKMAEQFVPMCQKFGMNPEFTGDALKLCQYLANLISIELEIRSEGNMEFAAAILLGEDPCRLSESALKRVGRLHADFWEFRRRQVETFDVARREIADNRLIIRYTREPSEDLKDALISRGPYVNHWQAAMQKISSASDISRMEMAIAGCRQELDVSRRYLPWKEIVSTFGLHPRGMPTDFVTYTEPHISQEMLLVTLAATLQLKGQAAGKPYISWRNLQKFTGKLDAQSFQDSARVAVRKYLDSLDPAPTREEKSLLAQVWDMALGDLWLDLPAPEYRRDIGPWSGIVVLSAREMRWARSALAETQKMQNLADGIPETVASDKPEALKKSLAHFAWGRKRTDDIILIDRIKEDYAPAEIIRSIPVDAYVVGLILYVWDAWDLPDQRILIRRLLREGDTKFWREMVPHSEILELKASMPQLKRLKQKLAQ